MLTLLCLLVCLVAQGGSAPFNGVHNDALHRVINAPLGAPGKSVSEIKIL